MFTVTLTSFALRSYGSQYFKKPAPLGTWYSVNMKNKHLSSYGIFNRQGYLEVNVDTNVFTLCVFPSF
jgi:hypothetical protein